jgi:hypothetical protein
MIARAAVFAVAAAVGSLLAGWWALPVLGLVWGVAAHRRRAPGRTAALGATLGWAGLLVWNTVGGEGWRLAARAGDTLGLWGAPGYAAATLVFAALLAGCAAAVGSALERVLR